ncbi:39S ribosomal protein L51, mitochondrial [Lodderomyces elongisporus]|uniref:39S ribosomal protein L51, mitochondrial n=1 Tax=Lodderomyces elongisporus TaxID=36914 RepID=UPI0029226FE2|nr:39S ribosomal protein L51, mitochondrial [Lodderomyces elongisporus]WLF79225.1 39S ribosomal protein L51, mitochondrial [Lodderomyces elongisporus]
MPVKAIPKLSIARNGVGAYVQPCSKVVLQYCNWGGSSNGLRQLLTSGKLNHLAKEKPHTVFEIKRNPGHPKLVFHYNNAKQTVSEIEVKNLNEGQILNKISEYIQRSGNELFKNNHKVVSQNESVRGIWSPLHVPKDHRYKI